MPSPILRRGEAATNNKQKLTEVEIEFTTYLFDGRDSTNCAI